MHSLQTVQTVECITCWLLILHMFVCHYIFNLN